MVGRGEDRNQFQIRGTGHRLTLTRTLLLRKLKQHLLNAAFRFDYLSVALPFRLNGR
jgi:hypothetical protein